MIDPEGIDKKPWDDRRRAVPLRTYSGTIKYRKRQKGWTEKDLLRVLQKIEPDPADAAGFLERIFRAYITLLKKWIYWVFTAYAYLLQWDWLKTNLYELVEIVIDALAEAVRYWAREKFSGFLVAGEIQKIGIQLMSKIGSAFGVSWRKL